MLDEFRNDTVNGIDRNRKPNTGIGSTRTHNLRIDTNQPPGTIEQGPTRVARIDRGVRLNHPFNRSIGH
jgi:hypothetical protein